MAIVGFPERSDGSVYNSAAVLADGAVHAIYRKVHLPNYGVFDEQRYFKAGEASGVAIDVGGHKLGITVCEDLWVAGAPATSEATAGASLIVNISASPYHAGKGLERERLFAQRANETGAHIAFCAMVGGQDELVFDGQSFVLDQEGKTLARATQFAEDLLVYDLFGAEDEQANRTLLAPIASRDQEVYEALLLGLHDYSRRTASARSCSGSPAGSTRRSWPAWQPMRLAQSA